MSLTRVAVIGGGLGGLSSAISLRAAGYQVDLFEKNAQIGGKLNVIEKDGFTFDLGPSILTLPHYFRNLFERAGKNFDDYVTLDPVSPQWRNFFEDGLVFDLHDDLKLMRREMDKLPGDPDTHWREFEEFMTYARSQFEVITEGYFDKGLDTLWEFIRYYGFRRLGKSMDYKPTMSEAIERRISDPQLRAIFEYFIKYVGSSALHSPGYMNMMSIIQFDHGLWYVRGGMYSLAKGFGKLMEEMGIRVHLNADVAEITRVGKTVTGLRLADGSAIKADLVVSNMEVIPCYEKLLGEPPRFMKKLKKFAPSCSGIVAHIGTRIPYPQLAHHNFFYSENQHKHFRTVFDEKKLPHDPTVYVVAPTRTDPSKAPAGCDNIKILPHIPPLDNGEPFPKEDYLALYHRILEKMERAGLKDLRKNIITEDLLFPDDIERMYRSNQGSIYGVVTDWKKNFGFKAPKTSTRYKNLYFCGGSTNPGGGMPMVVLSGQKVADRIIAKHPPK
ncbi:MAG: diapolycopene oxygenase [Paracoccaceae bacterium]|jgi:diapolycopene oxygenase